jgi:CMP-N-acetylneuraminic acid synthetase
MPIGGVSLVGRAVQCAAAAGIEAVVSTDCQAIYCHALEFGRVLRRRDDLGADDTEMVDVVLDAVDRLGLADTDIVVLLQPTSPFRSAETIKRAVAAFTGNPVMSVSQARVPHHGGYVIASGSLRPAPAVFTPNGCVYVVGVGFLRAYRSFTLMATPLLVDEREALDVDTESDFLRAREMAGEIVMHHRGGESWWVPAGEMLRERLTNSVHAFNEGTTPA